MKVHEPHTRADSTDTKPDAHRASVLLRVRALIAPSLRVLDGLLEQLTACSCTGRQPQRHLRHRQHPSFYNYPAPSPGRTSAGAQAQAALISLDASLSWTSKAGDSTGAETMVLCQTPVSMTPSLLPALSNSGPETRCANVAWALHHLARLQPVSKRMFRLNHLLALTGRDAK